MANEEILPERGSKKFWKRGLKKLGKDVKQTAYAMIQNSSVKIRKVVKEGFGGVTSGPPFSSPEAKKVIDGAIRNYAKDLRKSQYRIIKDWMSKAKSGVIDYFDLVRGLDTGDIARAKPFETKFLKGLLDRDKIMDRFRSYFGGKKVKEEEENNG